MTALRRIVVSLLVAAAVWSLFSWPLPRYVASGISSASSNVEKDGVRSMIAGDHLQFLYQFWLSEDTFLGHTQLFHDPYEFNTGVGPERTFRGTYYLPLSLFYTLGEFIGGRAFGYNFDQFVILWLTYFFTWVLIRRFCRDEWLSAIAAVISIAFPYLWITMLDGSPTGLAMMWVPIIFLGLDVMVKEKKIWGGAVAGAGILVSEWADPHVFFFSALAAPLWCIFSYLYHFPNRRPARADVAALLKAGSLLMVFALLVLFQAKLARSEIKDTHIKGGRSIIEIMNNSPALSGAWKRYDTGDSRKIFFGVYPMLLLLGSWAAWLLMRRKDKTTDERFPWLPVLLMCLAIMTVIVLAAGPRSQAGPRGWRLLTKLIPPYGMIRQPHKIFCLMPLLAALSAGILWPSLLGFLSIRARRVAALALLAPLALGYSGRIHPTICLLDKQQGAYRAVAEDARAAGNPQPHILAVPIWPGDSHYASLSQYYVSLYRIRMVNGYTATVKDWFMEQAFRPFESMNMGGIRDSQLDELLKRGVGYIVLHEDQFPEKVSPFPVGFTLQRLLNHPRLECIGKDAAVWAFKIQPAGGGSAEARTIAFMKYLPSSRRREVERSAPAGVVRPSTNLSIMGEGYITMTATGSTVRVPAILAPLDAPLCWLVRARGRGELTLSTAIDGVTNGEAIVAVDAADWTWKRVAVPVEPASGAVGAQMSLRSGAVDVDSVILGGGRWDAPGVGEKLEMPAACFFHEGYTERDFEVVVLRKAYEPAGIRWYGPKLPLEKGRYSVELIFETAAATGQSVGAFNVRWPGDEERYWTPVVAGSRVVADFEQKDNKPFFAAFRFDREADVKIRYLLLARIE